MGGVVALAGLLNIVSALTPGLRARISVVDTAFDRSFSEVAAGATSAFVTIIPIERLAMRSTPYRREYQALISLDNLTDYTDYAPRNVVIGRAKRRCRGRKDLGGGRVGEGNRPLP